MDPYAQQQPSGPNWAQILLTGVGAAIDSQIAQPYVLSNPTYNTAYGYGGQGQYGATPGYPGYPGTESGTVSAAASPLMLIAGVLVLFFVLKK